MEDIIKQLLHNQYFFSGPDNFFYKDPHVPSSRLNNSQIKCILWYPCGNPGTGPVLFQVQLQSACTGLCTLCWGLHSQVEKGSHAWSHERVNYEIPKTLHYKVKCASLPFSFTD